MCPKRRPHLFWTSPLVCRLVAACVVLWAAQSAAQDRCQADPDCRKLTQDATLLASQKHCDQAIPLYEQAYQRSNEPRLLLNIGRCEYRIGQPEKALARYDEFRRLRPKADAETSSRLGQFVAEAKLAVLAAEKERAAQASAAEVEPPPAPLQPERDEKRLFGRPLWRVATGAAAVGVGGVLAGLGIGALAVDGHCATVPPGSPGLCGVTYGSDGMRQAAVLDGVTAGVPMLVVGVVLVAGGITLAAVPARKPALSAWLTRPAAQPDAGLASSP